MTHFTGKLSPAQPDFEKFDHNVENQCASQVSAQTWLWIIRILQSSMMKFALLLVLSAASALASDLHVGDEFPRIELIHPQDDCFSEVPVLIEYNVTGLNQFHT
jgi:hypothetical protein